MLSGRFANVLLAQLAPNLGFSQHRECLGVDCYAVPQLDVRNDDHKQKLAVEFRFFDSFSVEDAVDENVDFARAAFMFVARCFEIAD